MRARLGTAFLWLVGSACGAGGDASGGSLTAGSGVSADKKIESLEDGEIRQLCEWSNELSETGLSDQEICTYDALLANSAKECEAMRDACLAKGSAKPPALLGVASQDCSKKTAEAVPEGCNATVEMVERCQRDLIDAMVADAMRASCSELGKIWTPVPASCPQQVLVCARLLSGS